MSRSFSLKKSIVSVSLVIFVVLVLDGIAGLVSGNISRFIMSLNISSAEDALISLICTYIAKIIGLVLCIVVAYISFGRSVALCFPLGIDDTKYLRLSAFGGIFGIAVMNFGAEFIIKFLENVGVFFADVKVIKTSAGLMGIVIKCLLNGSVVGVLKELLYRGIILQSLRYYSNTFAIFLSSVAYAVVQPNFVQAMFAFGWGCIVSVFCIRAGSIVPGIMLHFIYETIFMFFVEVAIFYGGAVSLWINISLLVVVVGFGVMAYFGLKNNYGNILWIPTMEDDYSFPRTSKQLLLSPAFLIVMFIAFIVMLRGVILSV